MPDLNTDSLARIGEALLAAREALTPFTPGRIHVDYKGIDDPVTAADRAVNAALKQSLLGADEGWLSEETADDGSRLKHRRVWVVDPIDGTKEFVDGIPEWAVSVGLVEDGSPVAGGVSNPLIGLSLVGGKGLGLEMNGHDVTMAERGLSGARILASRSEIYRGQWKRFDNGPFTYSPMGSIAFKLAMVACGRFDATFTLVPKNEWDVAGGVALIEAAGGCVVDLEGKPLRFNRPHTLYPGLIAGPRRLVDELLELLAKPPSKNAGG